jgi:hypothetical protein
MRIADLLFDRYNESMPLPIDYQNGADPPRRPPSISWHGLIAALAAVFLFFLLGQLVAGPLSRTWNPVMLLALIFTSATAVLGTLIGLLDRRSRSTFAMLALILTVTIVCLFCGAMGRGIGVTLLNWLKKLV